MPQVIERLISDITMYCAFYATNYSLDVQELFTQVKPLCTHLTDEDIRVEVDDWIARWKANHPEPEPVPVNDSDADWTDEQIEAMASRLVQASKPPPEEGADEGSKRLLAKLDEFARERIAGKNPSQTTATCVEDVEEEQDTLLIKVLEPQETTSQPERLQTPVTGVVASEPAEAPIFENVDMRTGECLDEETTPKTPTLATHNAEAIHLELLAFFRHAAILTPSKWYSHKEIAEKFESPSRKARTHGKKSGISRATAQRYIAILYAQKLILRKIEYQRVKKQEYSTERFLYHALLDE